MMPIIAIVGKPNVGKSTLFNRLAGKRIAITSNVAGTTRDRISHSVNFGEIETTIVDTGGVEYGKKENIEGDVQSQAKLAIQEADLIYFVVDATKELSFDDFAAADILRKSQKEILFILSKCDNEAIEQMEFNFFELGFGEPIKISAIHNIGVDELSSKTHKFLKTAGFKAKKKKQEDDSKIVVSILGRPNAGKSSLVNALFGKEKVIVSDVAGTTRDATDTEIEYQDKTFILTDTAGLRRRGKIEKGIEKFSSMRCLSSIQRSDVCVLMLDYEAKIAKQDCHIAEFILNEHKGLIIVVNKCDLMEEKEEEQKRFIRHIRRRFSFIPWASMVFISAKDRKHITKILEISALIKEERQKRIPTGEFNSFLEKITHKHLPSGSKRVKPKILYGTQVDTNPPEFTLFVNDPEVFHFSYPRYLKNQIRKEYGFEGTDIKINFKQRISKLKKNK